MRPRDVTAKPMIGFREFYDRFYRHKKPCLTTADELRDVVRAYKAFRRHEGLSDTLPDAAREFTYAARIEYHIGACELAELTGDTARTVKHRQAFMEVWTLWFHELSGESSVALPIANKERQGGFWKRLRQTVKCWGIMNRKTDGIS